MSNDFIRYIGRNACDSSCYNPPQETACFLSSIWICILYRYFYDRLIGFKESNDSMKTLSRCFDAALVGALSLAFIQTLMATENVPHAPFGEWADVPLK